MPEPRTFTEQNPASEPDITVIGEHRQSMLDPATTARLMRSLRAEPEDTPAAVLASHLVQPDTGQPRTK